MLSTNELLTILQRTAESEGFGLYDAEFPHGPRGVLRVFLCQRDGNAQGVDLQACARVAKRINDLPEVEELMPGDATLEVSSPGINRKLSRAEHFRSAVGERVRVSYQRVNADGVKKDTVRGILRSFNGDLLEIERESPTAEQSARESIQLATVKEARVDFAFK